MRSVSRREFVAGLAAFGVAGRARAADGWSLRNARILVGDGTEVQGGVRVEGGRIVEVGPGVKDGEDQGGKLLFPGFWDGGSRLGLYEIDEEGGTHDEADVTDAVVAQDRVIDGYNPQSLLIPVARRYGVVGTLVMPGGGALVAGQAAWMRTTGDTVDAATVAAPAGLVIYLGHAGTGAGNAPKARIGVAARLRDLLDANKPPPAADPKKKTKADAKPDEPTRAQAALRALRSGSMKALIYADRADDLATGMSIAKEFSLDVVFVGCAEGHLLARELADAGHPCILGPVTVQPDSYDHLYVRYDNAALLAKAGMRIGLRHGGAPHQLRDLTTEADFAVAYGLPWAQAIAAACANNPSFWGLQVGKLAPGYEATFVRADGDPFQPRTHVDAVWMQGVPASLRTHQTDLYERFETLR